MPKGTVQPTTPGRAGTIQHELTVVNFTHFNGRDLILSFKPDNIAISSTDELDVPVNGREKGNIYNMTPSKPQVTFTAEGVTGDFDLPAFKDLQVQEIIKGLHGQEIGFDMQIGGWQLYGLYVRSVTPSAPQKIGGVTHVNQIEVVTQGTYYQ